MSYYNNLSHNFDNLAIGSERTNYGSPSNSGYSPEQNRDNQTSSQPPYNPPYGRPALPQGWSPVWEQKSQRWYYVNTATGQSQWEAPGHEFPSTPQEDRGEMQPGSYNAPPGPYPASSDHDARYSNTGYAEGNTDKDYKKSGGGGGKLLGVAGGLAAGAIGGALLHEAFDDDDDDNGNSNAAPDYRSDLNRGEYTTSYSHADSYADVPPAVLPPTDADGNSVSSSDRESVQEAREEYEEALADAAASDASSSDLEEVEEAREEYEEEYEETYED